MASISFSDVRDESGIDDCTFATVNGTRGFFGLVLVKVVDMHGGGNARSCCSFGSILTIDSILTIAFFCLDVELIVE